MCVHNLQMQMNDFTLFQLWNFIQNEWANTVHHFLFSFLTNEMKIVKNTFWKTQNTNEQQRLNENSSLTENDENNSASHCTRNKNWEIQLVNENAVIKVKSWIYSDVLGFFFTQIIHSTSWMWMHVFGRAIEYCMAYEKKCIRAWTYQMTKGK